MRLLLERLEDRNLLAGDLECLRSRSIGDVALISHDVPPAPADIALAAPDRHDRASGIAGDASSHSDTINANGLDSEMATGAEPHRRPVVNWFEVLETLQSNPHVEYFEQIFRIQAQETRPNDADFPRQTYLDNPAGYDIAAPSVWDTTTGNRELIAGGGGIRNGNAGEGGGTLIIRDSRLRRRHL